MLIKNEVYRDGKLVSAEEVEVNDAAVLDTEARVAELEAMLAALLEVL